MFLHNGQRYYVTTTRFNEETYEQNQQYKRKIHFEGAMYGTPMLIASTVPRLSKCIVIEMLNLPKKHKDYPGKIVGIGMIVNRIQDRRFNIYNDKNYNRYTYTGKYFLNRSELLERDSDMIETIENCIFKGKGHLKRAQGITKVPSSFMTRVPEVGTKLLSLFDI